MIELKKGDELYNTSRGEIVGKKTIDRVTKTLAISGVTRFNKTQSNKLFNPKGASVWMTSYYQLRTKELDEDFYRQKLLKTFKRTDWDLFKTDALDKIKVFINSL